MVSAQPYGNEWIDPSRPYWHFTVAADGIYRIDSAALANAGFPVGTVDPRTIPVFGREQEVPIFIEGEADGVLNTADHIELQAMRNDGWMDGALYEVPGTQSNPFHSLYNDSIRYYITSNRDHSPYPQPRCNDNYRGIHRQRYQIPIRSMYCTNRDRTAIQSSYKKRSRIILQSD